MARGPSLNFVAADNQGRHCADREQSDELAKKTCTLNVTSLYEDARKPHSTPYEGGTTVLNFQRSLDMMPPPED